MLFRTRQRGRGAHPSAPRAARRTLYYPLSRENPGILAVFATTGCVVRCLTYKRWWYYW